MPAQARREQILDAAARMIAERGFWATSLREVGDACGITVAGVLHHFPSKDALLVAVLERRDRLDTQALGERLGVDLLGGEVPEVSLARLCRETVARNAGQREIVRLFHVLAGEALDEEHPAYEYFRKRQARALRGFAGLAPPGSDADAVARRAIALMEGLQVLWLRDPSRDWLQDWMHVTAGIPELHDES
jgi:AcrR family transcriptional regulator